MVIKNSVDICKFNEAFIQVALYLLLISHPDGGKKKNKFYSPISYLNSTIQKRGTQQWKEWIIIHEDGMCLMCITKTSDTYVSS
jgi:hypothetical protein